MSCTAPNAYQVDLVCDDTDMTDVLTGYVMDDYGNICGAVCAIVDHNDDHKVKVSFSNYLCTTTAWYYVCKDTSPTAYYVCMPGTATDPDCCPDCPSCMSDSEQTSRTCTVRISNVSDSNYSYYEGDWVLNWNSGQDCWYQFRSDWNEGESLNEDWIISVFVCSPGIRPYDSSTGHAQVLDIQGYLSGAGTEVKSNKGCSKGPHSVTGLANSAFTMDVEWEFSD